jgi:hypothetical protein
MKNRWSDAARAAALAVRQKRAFAANPQDKGKAVPQPGGRAPKPMAPKPTVFAGGSATFDESTGTRIDGSVAGPKPVLKVPYAKDNVRGNPGLHIWIPPPNDPHWNDPAFVESFKRGVAERKKTGLAAGTFPTKPNIFYSSSYPYGPGQEGRVMQGILRFDPKNPLDAAKLGYNTGTGKRSVPPVSERYKDDWLTISQRRAKEAAERAGSYPRPSGNATRVIIGGKRYTRVGNKLTPDVVEPGQKYKVYYQK